MKKIKILFLIDQLHVMGGTERQLFFIAENLPGDRFEPVIGVLYPSDYAESLDLSTPIVHFKSNSLPLLKNICLFANLAKYLRREKIDIVHTFFHESPVYAVCALFGLRQRPILITTRRNMYHWVEEEPWAFRLLRLTNRGVDYTLVNSHAVRERCIQLEHLSPEKLRVIQNAIEVEKFNIISKKDARSALKLDENAFIVGSVGNWRPVKGMAQFLESASILSKMIPEAHFVLVGHGPQEEDLKGMNQDNGVGVRTHFFPNDTDIPTVMAALDVAVQPSLSESLSNVLLEYMASERPIVATRVGDAERVIESERDGILVQPDKSKEMADAIYWLYSHPEEAENMARVSREKVKRQWSSEKILNEYINFYSSCIIPMK